MQRLGERDDARLLWFATQAHGTGPAYRVITITAIADGAAWERLARNMQDGELTDWVHHTDSLRHDVTAKLLLPVRWSPLNEMDLAAEPAVPADHEPTLFMEDTGWPHTPLDDYVDFWERDYYPLLAHQPEATRLLEIQACWVPALGAGRRPEAIFVATHPQPGPLHEVADHRGPARATSPRHLHGHRTRLPRPVGVPTLADGSVVTALVICWRANPRVTGVGAPSSGSNRPRGTR